MMNRMNKHINTLSFDDVQLLEQREHRLAKPQSQSEIIANEKLEHKLKKKPTLRQLLKIETKEHANPNMEDDEEED